MIETIHLSPGVTLRCIRDDRFKHGCLSLQLLRPMDRQEAALNALLPAVLLRGTQSCPDLRAITLRLDDLYGAGAGALVRRVGDCQTTGFYCSFTEDRYAMEGDRILEPTVGFLRELLLEPALEQGCFRESYVESEKRNLIATIESQLNDKRAYAMAQLLKSMCRCDSFGIPRLGEPREVAAITARTLWDHYVRILQESPVQLFYVGSFPAERVAQLLQPLARELSTAAAPLPPQSPFRDGGRYHEQETMDVSQGKLCLGYTTPITTTHPDFAAMQVMNALFGGGMTNKLFQVIREKLSLCYAIGSGYHGVKGLLTVSAGIDFDREDQVRQEIAAQLRACQEGRFTDGELTAARESLRTSLLSIPDSPGALENYYATAALSGLSLTTGQYLAALDRVSTQDVIRAANTVQLHSSFFLKGVE